MNSIEIYIEKYLAEAAAVEEFEKRRYIAEKTLLLSIILGGILIIYFHYFDSINDLLPVGNIVYYIIGPIAIILFFGGFYSDELNKKHRPLSEEGVMYHHLALSMKYYQVEEYAEVVKSLNNLYDFYNSLRRRGDLNRLSPIRKSQLFDYIEYINTLDDPTSFVQEDYGEVAKLLAEEINTMHDRAITVPDIDEDNNLSPTSLFIQDIGRIAGRLLTGFSGVVIFASLIGSFVYYYVGIQAGLTVIVIVLTAYGLHR